MKPAESTEHEDDDRRSLIFNELRPKIRQIVRKVTIPELNELAVFIMKIFESNEYSSKVYLEALIFISGHGIFDSNTALMAQECIVGLGDSPEIVSMNYE
jgi:hypothetical protein